MTETEGITEETAPAPSGGATLRRRIMITAALSVIGIMAGLAFAANGYIHRVFETEAENRLHDAAQRSAAVVDRMLLERERELAILAGSPMLLDAARAGTRSAESLGLTQASPDELEKRFGVTRTLAVDARARAWLAQIAPRIGVVEAILTDRYGHNAVTTAITADFVQSDESWWELASRNGAAPTEALFDDWSKQVVMTMSAALTDPATSRTAGVLKLTYDLAHTDSALLRGATTGGGIQVELVDADNNVIASSTTTARMKPLAGANDIFNLSDSVSRYLADGRASLAAVAPVGRSGWRVIAHVSRAEAFATATRARRWLLAASAGLALLMLGGLRYLDRFVTRRISQPLERLAVAAEAVAGGDLSVEVGGVAREDDEIGRLARATATMIYELRRLATTLRTSSSETAAMAAEITDGAAAMAQTSEAMAHTSNDLSSQSTTMSQTITQFAGDSTRLVAISSELDAGSHEGLERNIQLRDLAVANRQRLDQSSTALQALSSDVAASAAAADSLAQASEEIRAFVTFVQKMARQSKLLALNAAMEAARAGVHGQGFAVVASEVRRLAAGAAEAAERTEILVRDVLARVGESRDSTARTVQAVESVFGATKEGLESFALIEGAVAENEEWMRAISRASTETHELVGEMTSRLESVSRTTESFAASMEEVAASTEEQSAQTHEIAEVARALAAASQELAQNVARFRLERSAPGAEPSGPTLPVATPAAGAAVSPPLEPVTDEERALTAV